MSVAVFPAVASGQAQPDGPPPLLPTLTVNPNSGLQDFDQVSVSGTGYPPSESVLVIQCVMDDTTTIVTCPSSGPFGVPFPSWFFETDAGGSFSGTIRVRALDRPPGTDCRVEHCVLVTRTAFGGGVNAAVADIEFDPTLPLRPESFSVVPDTGLVDGQVVEVRADNTESSFFINYCAGDPFTEPACRRVSGGQHPDADGAVRFSLAVERRPEIGDQVFDCLEVECSIFLSGAPRFGPFVVLPLEFAAVPGENPAPAGADPAAVVAATPRFTG
jgi:hypothetical protein